MVWSLTLGPYVVASAIAGTVRSGVIAAAQRPGADNRSHDTLAPRSPPPVHSPAGVRSAPFDAGTHVHDTIRKEPVCFRLRQTLDNAASNRLDTSEKIHRRRLH